MKKRILFFVKVLVFLSIFTYLGKAGANQVDFDQYKGIASWYSQHDPGVLKTTASMAVFNHNDFTCAMWDMPFGTKLRVTNLNNGKSVIVKVNDRGPAKRLVKRGRIVDLSKKAFSKIASLGKGLIKVEVSVLSYP